MAKSDLEKLMDTLKVDSTSPWVNKDTLMKAMKASNIDIKALKTAVDNRIEYNIDVEDITALTEEEINKLRDICGVYDNTTDTQFLCFMNNGKFTFVEFNEVAITFIDYTQSNEYDGTYTYDIAAMQVVANPTLAGTEDALTGLQVGDTKYAVSGGTKLYRHNITDGDVGFNIISTQATAFTNASSIQNAMWDNKILLASPTDYMGYAPSSIEIDTVNNTVTLYFLSNGQINHIQYSLSSLTDTPTAL